MSGSPHGVFGWTQPFGVSMKWLASLGGPRIDWPCAVTTKIAGAKAPSKAMRSVSTIRRIVTPKGTRPNPTTEDTGAKSRWYSETLLGYRGPDRDVHVPLSRGTRS